MVMVTKDGWVGGGYGLLGCHRDDGCGDGGGDDGHGRDSVGCGGHRWQRHQGGSVVLGVS
ncbi:hypothetical protein C1H46_005750 [Malus baccata]|uniref:Uncharacterized protein n=1 Tax=Malus baccata TaxID=106549 RepID=A0A540NC93_MALBA|nr:hypothetical protein C1H46_005750 [Malus baccata]